MSYDIYLEVGAGGPEPVEAFWVNYTSNCAPMWRKAMPQTDGLAGLHGLSAENAAQEIEAGLAAMDADRAAYEALNPDNGWGDFEGQREMLVKLLAACRAYPKAVVAVSR